MTKTTTKRLYRSRTDKKIAGVCAGLGDYFGLDPAIFRIIAVLLLLPGGPSALIYFILWIILPLEPVAPDKSDRIIVDQN